MRTHSLTTAAAAAFLAAMPAYAQVATWTGSTSGNWNTNGNWSPATVPTSTAIFDNTGLNQSLNISANASINTMPFIAGAPAYSFAINSGVRFDVVGAGIINNSSNAPSFSLTSISILAFSNSSTAGNAVIANNGINAVTTFSNSSTAGTATITNTAIGSTTFNDTSTASNANITSALSGFASFLGSSTAANATITTNFGGSTFFNINTTAGNATVVTNNGGSTQFTNSSTAGNATVVTNNGGSTQFTNSSTAGNATVATDNGGSTRFFQSSTGGKAAFTTQAGGIFDMSGLSAAGMTAGSIEGRGTYFLGSKALTVGGNNLSTTVNGTISDGGAFGGTGGSLVKVGTGTLTLAGTNSYAGGTIINGGALLLTGDISSSSGVTVNAGAMLGGTGMAPGITMNGGTLMPGLPNAVGTLNVAGSLVLTSAATYLININATSASQTNVTGTATLAGATVQVVDDRNIVKRQVYTLLTATGGVNGTFNPDVIGVKNKVELFYDANHAFLCDHCKTADILNPGLPGSPASPFNIARVGDAIDAAINADVTLPTSFANLLGLSRPQLIGALTQLTGEAATGAQKVGFQMESQFLNLMLDPFVDGRSGVGGAGHPALGFAPGREAMPPEIALAYASVFKAPAAATAPVYEPRWTTWGGAYGGGNRTSGDPTVIGSHDLSANTAGFAGGFDYRLTPNSVVGLAVAGGGTNWSLSQGLGGGKSDAFQAGVYGATRSGPAYLVAAFAFTNHWMSTDRFAVGDQLTANFNAQSYGGRVEGGYRFDAWYGGVTPYAAIQAQSFHTPGYTETDAFANGFALAFGSRDATDTRSELGARFDRVLALYPNAVLALRGRLAWAHDWVSDPTLTPVFQSLPGASFIVTGATPAQNSALASAGAELRLANGITLLAKFDGEFASHSSTYAGTGTLRYAW